MKILKLIFLCFIIFSFSCKNEKGKDSSNTKRAVTIKDNIHITMDPDKTTPLPLSEIAEDVRAIELEVTDKSMIGAWKGGYRVYPLNKYIVFFERSRTKNQILLFNQKGKFIRPIGRKGHGPGEFSSILSIAVDEKNERIYALDQSKVICFSFKGQMLLESHFDGNFIHIQQYKDNLLLLRPRIDGDGYNRTLCYKADMNLQTIDSMYVQYNKRRKRMSGFLTSTVADFFSLLDDRIYFHLEKSLSIEIPTRDTLFEIRGQKLIPSVTFSFPKAEYYTYVPYQVFRSSRFVCVRSNNSSFCYDILTEKSYNSPTGYKDDIHTGEDVQIRPFPNDSERFYYLHTNIKDTDKDEPNPTLYIGRFKQ